MSHYYVLVMSALPGGAIVAIVGMLYAAIRDSTTHGLGLDEDYGLRQADGKSRQDGATSEQNQQ